MSSRAKRRSPAPAAPVDAAADHGTPERARHGELVTQPTDVPGVTGRRVRHECRLDWYLDRCSIADRQHAAGLRFRADWTLATSTARLVGSYTIRVPRGPRDFTDSQLAARRRVMKVVNPLASEAVAVLIDVCCLDQWASGRLPLLRESLDRLADGYGLQRDEIGQREKG
jgi:Domain of unknown function (DUF6456)